MDNLLVYLIRVSTGTAILYVTYMLLFSKDTFYRRNRILLVLILLIPAILPAIKIPVSSESSFVANTSGSIGNLLVPVIPSSTQLPEDEVSFDFNMLLIWIYLLPAIFFLIRCILGIIFTRRIIKKGNLVRSGFPKIVVTDLKLSPFSFFPYIVIPSSLSGDENYNDVLNHEMAHVRQGHTFDVLISEFLIALQWFNPFAWMTKRSIRLNHEYLADNFSLEGATDIKEYQLSLLRFNTSLNAVLLAHNFNSVVKNRIIMINRKRSSRLSAMKSLIILPVALFITWISATPEYRYVSSTSNSVPTEQVRNDQAKGIVLGEEGKPLKLVTIVMRPSPPDIGVQTGTDGRFLITGLVKDAELEFSCIGYKTQVLKADFSADMVVIMGKDPNYKMSVRTPDASFFHEGPNVRIVLTQLKDAIIIIDGKNTGKKGEITLIRDDIAASKLLKGAEAVDKYGDNGKNGVLEIVTKKYAEKTGLTIPNIPMSSNKPSGAPAFQVQNADAALTVVDEMPVYPGGEAALLEFIKNNIKYPAEARAGKVEGMVIVRFIVTKEGKTEEVSAVKGVHPLIDAEAVRVISMLKNWEPGKDNGKTVNVWFMIPVKFELTSSGK